MEKQSLNYHRSHLESTTSSQRPKLNTFFCQHLSLTAKGILLQLSAGRLHILLSYREVSWRVSGQKQAPYQAGPPTRTRYYPWRLIPCMLALAAPFPHHSSSPRSDKEINPLRRFCSLEQEYNFSQKGLYLVNPN